MNWTGSMRVSPAVVIESESSSHRRRQTARVCRQRLLHWRVRSVANYPSKKLHPPRRNDPTVHSSNKTNANRAVLDSRDKGLPGKYRPDGKGSPSSTGGRRQLSSASMWQDEKLQRETGTLATECYLRCVFGGGVNEKHRAGRGRERTERGRTWNVDLRSLRRPPFPILGSCQSSAPVPATSSAACFSAFANASSLALLALTAKVDTATSLAVTNTPCSSTSCPLSLRRRETGPLAAAAVDAAAVAPDLILPASSSAFCTAADGPLALGAGPAGPAAALAPFSFSASSLAFAAAALALASFSARESAGFFAAG